MTPTPTPIRALAAAAALAAAGCGERPAPAGPSPVPPPDAAPAAADDPEAVEAARTAAIEQAMNDLAPVANQCWAAAAADDYRLAGDVQLLVDVDAAGAPTVTVHADTTRDPVLTDCLRAVAAAYAWAPPMRGHAALLPFRFTAPAGQNVIDRRLVPEIDLTEGGARVVLDAAATGNAAASIFELALRAGQAMPATASERAEVWYFLHETAADSIPRAGEGDAVYLPPGAVRAPRAPAEYPLEIVVVAVPGGDERATRRAGVLPASPADVRDRKRPRPVAAPTQGAHVAPRSGMGTVTILVDPARVPGAAMSLQRLEIDAGAAIPEHVHDTSTELLYVLSGAGTMTVDGVSLPVEPTSVIQIPAGTPHAFTASAAMVALQVYTPAGPEQRFKQP